MADRPGRTALTPGADGADGAGGQGALRPEPTEDWIRRVSAVSDPTRRRVWEALVVAAEPCSVAELTGVAGVHHTVVRLHLKALRDAGLVEETTAAPAGRGRPKLLYRARPDRGEDGYRELASLLARAVTTGRTVREVGRELGDELGGEVRGGADPVGAMAAVARRLGFDPVVETDGDGAEVVLRRCPYADVAATDAAAVCDLHLGIAEGVAVAVGGVEVTGLEVQDPHRAGCRLRLGST